MNFVTNFNIGSYEITPIVAKFLQACGGQISYAGLGIQITGTLNDLFDAVINEVNYNVARSIPSGSFHEHHLLYFSLDNEEVLLAIISVAFASEPYKIKKRMAHVAFYGKPQIVEEAYKKLEKKYPQEKGRKVNWYFLSGKNEIKNFSVDLAHRDLVIDEFCPWIEEGIVPFQKAFLEDDANVLLLIGEPGTGKTTFVRDLIHRNDLATAITHDEKLMHMDEFFIQFMIGDDELLVLEDADSLLRERTDGNQTMSKLLNTSDGLVRTKKKIILTANITHLENVDSALTRPGRCFDVLSFRELSTKEANLAAIAAGIPPPDQKSTLANLFKGTNRSVARRTGFHNPEREIEPVL